MEMIYIKEKRRRDVQSTFEETKYIVTNNRIKFCKPKKKDKKRILKFNTQYRYPLFLKAPNQ